MFRHPAAAWRLSLALLLVAAVGCGKPKGSLSGKVTYNGQPVPGGRVLFQPAQGAQLAATISDTGTYSISGVPTGEYKVAVDNTGLKERDKLMAGPGGVKPPNLPEMPKVQGTYVPLPPNASNPDQSGLKVTVKGGSQPFDIDVK